MIDNMSERTIFDYFPLFRYYYYLIVLINRNNSTTTIYYYVKLKNWRKQTNIYREFQLMMMVSAKEDFPSIALTDNLTHEYSTRI